MSCNNSAFCTVHFHRILSRVHAKGWKSQNDFKFGTSVGHFASDRAAGTAVKGLKATEGNTSYRWVGAHIMGFRGRLDPP